MGCCPVSSRLITIRLRAVLSIITIAHAYAPTSGYNDNEIEYLYDRLQNVIDQTPKNYILVGKQKWARMPVETGKAFVDSSAITTQTKEDSGFWSLPPSTTLSWRTHLVSTKHPEDVPGHVSCSSSLAKTCLLYTSPSPRDGSASRMPSSA